MKKNNLNAFLVFTSLLLIGGGSLIYPGAIFAAEPFSCTIDSFMFKSQGRAYPTYASTIDLKTGAGSSLNNGSSIHHNDVNAIGYNTVDNYIWGYDRQAQKVARVDSGFNVETYTVAGLPKNGFHIGDVSSDGILFLAEQWNDKGAIYKVDVNPSSSNYKKYIGKLSLKRANGNAYNNFFTNIADFAFNPVDGQIYTINKQGVVFKINPDSGVVTEIIDIGSIGSNAVAIFFDKDGYFYYDAYSKIYRIKISNPQKPNNSFSDLSVSADGDAARCPKAGIEEPPEEPEPSTGNGTLRYANSGTGQYKDRILFMDWHNSALKDGIQTGDKVEFEIPEKSCLANGKLTATFVDVVDENKSLLNLRPSDMRTWGGASFYSLYNTSGSGEAIYLRQLSPDDQSSNASFVINWEMEINGETHKPDIFLMDAESTSNNREQIRATTDGGGWSIIENALGDQYVIDGVGTKTIDINNTEVTNIDDNNPVKGWSPLLLSKAVGSTTININTFGVNGNQAVAFGLLAPCDHGDAPTGYGDAGHAFKEIQITEAKDELGLKFLTGTPYIGATPPDSEFIQAGGSAQQDDSNNDAFDASRNDDEDMLFPSLPQGTSKEIIIPVTGEGYLQVWVDWNIDGDFDDAGEQVVTNQSSSGGDLTITVAIPEDATLGASYARIRYSSQENLAASGYAKDGEVEDIAIEITENVCRIDDLSHSLYSTSSVAANSGYLSDSTRVYQAKFSNNNWLGKILAYDLKTTDNDGNVKSLKWNTETEMSRTGRTIITYNPTLSGSKGSVFNWASLNASQKTLFKSGDTEALGQKRVAWTQGSDADESSLLRPRTTIMGDMVHSGLTFQGELVNYGYKYLNGSEKSSYAAFLITKKDQDQSTLYVGANDGMLHAFDSDTGAERFSYIPNEVYDKLAGLSNKKYGCKGAGCLPHEYLVDGTSSVGDAYIDGSWRTVLVGTLGLGGKGIFALDVTSPASFDKDDVLWEISSRQATVDSTNANTYAQLLGYSLPAASVVRLKNGQWAAVVANGYDSQAQTAALFLINIETGALIKKFVVPAIIDTDNGLSTPTPVDSNGDYVVDVIYAGDLLGNLWAFDVSNADPDKWKIKYGTSTAPKPLFKACEGSTCPPTQSITAAPQIGKHPAGGLMIYFGTGRYFDVNDNMFEDTTPAANSFYGIRDNNVEVEKDKLVAQAILKEITVSTDFVSRVTSTNPVDYATAQGWYMPLLSPEGVSKQGERVISQALLRGGRIIFTTMTPPQNDCIWGGKSWIMELNAIDGNRLNVIPFDTNNDKQFTEADNVTYNDSSTIISGVQKPSLGVIFSTPAVITHTTRAEGKYVTGTGGSVGMFRESASRFSGRMSWRKLK